jgi:hypothetical protein
MTSNPTSMASDCSESSGEGADDSLFFTLDAAQASGGEAHGGPRKIAKVISN